MERRRGRLTAQGEQLGLHKHLKRIWYALCQTPPREFIGKALIAFLPRSYVQHIRENILQDWVESMRERDPKTPWEDLLFKGAVARYYSSDRDSRNSMNKRFFWGGN